MAFKYLDYIFHKLSMCIFKGYNFDNFFNQTSLFYYPGFCQWTINMVHLKNGFMFYLLFHLFKPSITRSGECFHISNYLFNI